MGRCALQVEEAGWLGNAKRLEDLLLVGCCFSPLLDRAMLTGKPPQVHSLQGCPQVSPTPTGLGLSDPDEQQSQPAEQHVGPDPFRQTVIDRLQV